MISLGPRSLDINEAVGLAGMSLFFTLSGFLITTNLKKHPDVLNFLIRRCCRILPLAYLATVVYMVIQAKSWPYWVSHYLFLVNYDHAHLTPLTNHFWSLCVEVHFYLFMALLTLILGVTGLRSLPVFALIVTSLRIATGSHKNIMTHLRVDDILAGTILALIYTNEIGRIGRRLGALIEAIPLLIWLPLFAVSCHPTLSGLIYLKPYLGSIVVGHTLLNRSSAWSMLRNRPMRYFAEVSYAIYVIHPLSMAGWLGSGDRLVKYAKRPLSFALTFALAHLSTFHMERHFIAWGKRLTHHLEKREMRRKPREASV